jgi:hypothetical protein
MTLPGKVRSDDRTSWDETLTVYRGQLQFYLDYLLECECANQILAAVDAEVRESSVSDEFKHRFLIRTLVRNVIQHLRDCSQQTKSPHYPTQESPYSVATVPAQERLVYFMRDILQYPTRDASLLIGVSDTQVEKLLAFARKRIDMSEGPASLAIETSEEVHFRWRLVDLHLN